MLSVDPWDGVGLGASVQIAEPWLEATAGPHKGGISVYYDVEWTKAGPELDPLYLYHRFIFEADPNQCYGIVPRIRYNPSRMQWTPQPYLCNLIIRVTDIQRIQLRDIYEQHMAEFGVRPYQTRKGPDRYSTFTPDEDTTDPFVAFRAMVSNMTGLTDIEELSGQTFWRYNFECLGERIYEPEKLRP
jgi:hypothetical protein